MNNRFSKDGSAEQQLERALALADKLSNVKLKEKVKPALRGGCSDLVFQCFQISLPDLQIILDILPCTEVREMAMRNCALRNAHAIALAQNTTLRLLDVFGNYIGDEGAKALAKNKTLTDLYMDYNEIGPEGGIALAKNTTLNGLGMRCNQIGDDGAKALAQNTTLRTLNVHGNYIRDKGAKALAQNTTLRRLELGENYHIGDEGEKALIDAAEHNYFMLVIGGFSLDAQVKLEPYWERNKKLGLRETLDQADQVIKQELKFVGKTPPEMANDVSTIYIPANDSAIERLNDTLSLMQEETSDVARKIISQLNEMLTQCVAKQISYYYELAKINRSPVDTNGLINAHLAIPSSHPDYQAQRITAFENIYFCRSDLDDNKSILPAFCIALETLIPQDDDSSLLVGFTNENHQKIFDTALSTANGKVLHLGDKVLESDLRKQYLESAVDQWKPTDEKEIELKARLNGAICRLCAGTQNPFSFFRNSSDCQPGAVVTASSQKDMVFNDCALVKSNYEQLKNRAAMLK